MTKHAIAKVKWETYRSGGTGGVAVYDYGSDQKRLLERVADGGTLWLITSTRRRKELRKYHLAYKLVNCASVSPEQSIFSGKWQYVVRAQDRGESRHFGYNDATDTLCKLQFTSGKPMSAVSNMGLRLLSIPELATQDVVLLQRLQHKIENSRSVFVSYSHEDASWVENIEYELSKRDVSVSRDVAFLVPGQEFEEAIQQEVTGTDSFIVLISPRAAESSWVRREISWAVKEYRAHGLVNWIIPIVLPSGGWDHFPELHSFQRWDYPAPGRQQEGFDLLANGIVLAKR